MTTTNSKPQHHMWGTADGRGVRACLRDGCTIRTADHYRRWQRKPGALWTGWLEAPIPECQGEP